MIKAGHCICHKCGQVSKFAFYSNATTPKSGVVLFRSVFNRLSVKNAKIDNSPTNKNYALSDKTPMGPNLPWPPMKITAIDKNNNNTEQELVRICPKCAKEGNINRLFPRQGALPTYIIGVIGSRQSGKSCFLHGITITNYLDNLKDKFKVKITPWKYTKDIEIKYAPTDRNSLGNSLMLTLSYKETAFANVLLIDTAGEANETGIDIPAQILSKTDGFIFIKDPTANQNDSNKAIMVFNEYTNMGYLNNKPIAYVNTKLDLINNPPLCDKDTFQFDNNNTYKPKDLFKRWALESWISNRLNSGMPEIDNPGSQHSFIIKSCSSENSVSKFENPINIFDPLIWLLNQLGLFPIAKSDR